MAQGVVAKVTGNVANLEALPGLASAEAEGGHVQQLHIQLGSAKEAGTRGEVKITVTEHIQQLSYLLE